MKPTSLKLLLCLSLAFNVSAFGEEKPPNVVLIFADDLGYGDLGCYGATKLKTPNIDKLAAEGRKFTDAHSSSAVCTPSRYGLLTGEYPSRALNGKGIWGPAPITSGLLIPPDTLTIADLFKKKGYDTAVFGKWHLGFGDGKNDWKQPLRPGPQDLGFDYYFGMPVVNSAPPYVYVENDRVVGSDPNDPLVHLGRGSREKATPITPIPPKAAQRSPNQFGGAVEAHKLFNDYEVGTKLTEKATGWIKAREGTPFFLYFATTNVHHPFTPAKRFQDSSECGVYGDFVHELDWIVGEVMKTLEAAGVADNTLVIFTSDNGGMFNLGGRAAAELGHKINGDLLGSKFGIWEGGHRIPFIARWPGKIEGGSVSDQTTISVDLLSTFAALTGQELSEKEQKDSINMLPALTGTPDKPLRTETILTAHKPSHMALRKGKWMFIPSKSDGGFTGSKPGQHAWGGPSVTKLVGTPNSDIDITKGIFKKDAPPAQLYDLEADVNQTTNLYLQNSEKAQEMREQLDAYRRETKKNAPAGDVPTGKTKPRTGTFKPLGNLRFTFESGTLDGWKMVEGDAGEAVSALTSLPRHQQRPFQQQGKFHLSTIITADGPSDLQQVTFQSPSFIIRGDQASFLASGGFDANNLYVGLVNSESGKVLLKAGGPRGPQMQRTLWDLSKFKGQSVHLQVVDRSTTGWGHLTFDDFSVDGELITTDSKKNKTPIAPETTTKPKKLPRPATDNPNFVVIFTDDLGYGDISCYNPKATKTPNIDALATAGFRSTDFFVPANVCSPSRAALLTGRYPMRCGMPVARNKNFPKYSKYGFNTEETTIPDLLKPAGYRSLMVGKWHLGMDVDGCHPLDAGFDEHLGIPSNFARSRGPGHNTLYRGREVEQENTRFEELTKRYTDEIVDFIGKRKEEPFFIYFAHHIPHTPILPRKEFLKSSGKGKYGDVIKELDHSTGRIMKALRDAGLDENTLVVFTSDNGPTKQGSAGGLNGGKYGTMEGGHRVPGIFRWTGKIAPKQVSDLTLTSMDLLPIFCNLADVELPADRKLDGKNTLPIMLGKESATPHKLLYYYNGTNLQAVREGDWKLHLPRTPKDQPFWCKKKGPGRVFVTLDQNTLYNLKEDLGEKHNVAEQNPEVVEHLLKQAETIRAELGDVRVTGTDQRAINLVDPQER